jgi:DNA-binding transcriptional ArsR family regulator
MKTGRDVFQAIADPKIQAITMLLTLGALMPNSLAEHFNTSRQVASKHLQILTECEIVNQEQQGRAI